MYLHNNLHDRKEQMKNKYNLLARPYRSLILSFSSLCVADIISIILVLFLLMFCQHNNIADKRNVTGGDICAVFADPTEHGLFTQVVSSFSFEGTEENRLFLIARPPFFSRSLFA